MIVTSPDRAPAITTTLVAFVAHARSVPSLIREAFGDAVRDLPEDPRRILVRTCHRVELYAANAGAELPGIELPPGIDRLEDADAVRHLLSVACGLDSTVFGETQILHQLRETIEERHAERALDPVLDRLFQAALRAGREARAHFSGSPRSLADVALDRIEAGTGHPVASRDVLVVGAGRMARLAALAAARRGARVLVANRTASRAAAVASDVDGRILPFESDGALSPLAGVVVAIAGPWPIGLSDLGTLDAAGTVVVDLSSPPALGPGVAERLGDRVISVDDLAATGEAGPDERLRIRVDRVVSRHGTDYCQWLRARGAVPAIQAVVGAAESRRAEELAWLRRRLPNLSKDEIGLIEQMSHRLVASLLHAPLSALTADEDGALEPAARELFGL
jgi:glutamyl-tRNA reductase